MARTAWLVGCIVALAGLDLVGALLAQQYAQRHLAFTLAMGAVTFVALFLVYAFSLNYAQLSIVTMSWIVLLQVGLFVIDIVHAQLHLNRTQALALVAILGLQCYLIVSTQSPSPTAAPPRPDGLSVPEPQPAFTIGGSAPPSQRTGTLSSGHNVQPDALSSTTAMVSIRPGTPPSAVLAASRGGAAPRPPAGLR